MSYFFKKKWRDLLILQRDIYVNNNDILNGSIPYQLLNRLHPHIEEIILNLDYKPRYFILYGCSWSNFQIDWRMFAYFKDGFWRSDNLSHKFAYVCPSLIVS